MGSSFYLRNGCKKHSPKAQKHFLAGLKSITVIFSGIKIYKVAGKEYETYYCTGNGENKIFIFPNHPWVIVITASAYGTGYAHARG